ncbi:MAG: sensor histidine kinase [Anaerolineae bacterium]
MQQSAASSDSRRHTERVLELVRSFRLALPVTVFLAVLAHQAWQASVVDQWQPSWRIATGVMFYGVVGPLVTFFMLDWIERALVEQEEAVSRFNRELEERVAERTTQLRQATSELRTKNDELTAANAELMQLDAMKNEFVALVSHELRAPLTNINASVELLLQRGPDDRDREKLEIVGQEASRLTGLVQSVLDVSRMEAGLLEINPAPVATRELCESALRRSGALLEGRECTVSIADGTPGVLADADRVHQVLRNLLENAAKYSPGGSPVTVAARPVPDEDAVLLCVTDHGIGIPADQLERVFERFHRVERGDARETYGHGLGLYIARRIVELHRGRMWVRSTLGSGSTFLFTLPAAPE